MRYHGQRFLALRSFVGAAAIVLAVAFGAPGARPAFAAPVPVAGDGQAEVEKKAGASLVDVLERVRVAAAGDEWRKEGWTDPVIEGWIAQAIAAVRDAGHGKDLPEPVKFADYGRREPLERPGPEPFAAPRPGEGALVVAKRLNVGHLRHTIALVDGDAEVGFANDCVIVARGAVRIAHGSGNIVLAGTFIHVSHDGSDRSRVAMMREVAARHAEAGFPAPEQPEGRRGRVPPVSLLVSGGVLDVSHAGQTVCAAGQLVKIGHAWDCVFVNSPRVDAGRRVPGVDLQLDKIDLGPAPKPHPLEAHLRLHAAGGENIVIFFFKDRRYVGEKGKPITDEAGAPVPELAGWVVSLADSEHAVLSNDEERASIVMTRQRGQ